MKIQRLAALLAAVCLLLAGCGSAPAAGGVAPTSDAASPVQNDLTQMSGTMVYSYVFAMLTAPEDYVGQSFRIRGAYSQMADETTGQVYHFVVVADATECCAQGLEFRLPGEAPAYPAPGAEIEIVGTYASYEEDGLEYVRIEASALEVLPAPPA
ncbi:MAG: hypothetical protein GX558_03305 [Clostridiales bacterium]|nr:hypothetical protein [Clostridiales bacterium]